VRLRLALDQHGGTAPSSTPESEENSKSEYRNPKQIRNSNGGKTPEIIACPFSRFSLFEPSSLFRIVRLSAYGLGTIFGFRISFSGHRKGWGERGRIAAGDRPPASG
jgi:hypothetical protein